MERVYATFKVLHCKPPHMFYPQIETFNTMRSGYVVSNRDSRKKVCLLFLWGGFTACYIRF